jgi:glycosyltransferase involved in cell wall biosynthesis
MGPAPLLVCASDNWDPGWRWVADQPALAGYRWEMLDATRKSWIEERVTRPNLTRYRVALRAASAAVHRDPALVISHQPRVTCLTALALRARRARVPHIGFTFNFTDLPGRPQRELMRRAFRDVDLLFTFSTFEIDLYAATFDLPPERFRMLHFGFDPAPPAPGEEGASGVEGPYLAAVGGEGRDYRTLFAAMRALPDLHLEVVSRPHVVADLDVPPNVTVRTNVPVEETHRLMRGAELLVLPLSHSEVPCGHVTMVTAMHMGKAQVVTRSTGVSDYVADGDTALLADPGDADDLAGAIRRLWDDDALRTQVGERGRAFAAAHCTDRHVAEVVAGYLAERGL